MARTALEWRRRRLPPWLRKPLSRTASGRHVGAALGDRGRLPTICEEARCPNTNECWARGTATFLILGDVCTRACRFCSVQGGVPAPPDPAEPERVARAVERMKLRHVVITSVNRDDLPDQGSGQFAACIAAVRECCPGVRVEVLVPDFRGVATDVDRVLEARPEVFNHNVETVPRLYRKVRPGARYERTLEVLARARRAVDRWSPRGLVKSGLMLGFGESEAEVDALLVDLHGRGVEAVTIGQYLAPSTDHLPVEEFVTPERFAAWRERGREIGFRFVFSGPFVRSSYMADAQVADAWQAEGEGAWAGEAAR